MSISSELASLAANKAAIKAAIEAKKPEVAPTNDLAQWPTAIGSIPTGGGGGGITGHRLTVYGDQSGSYSDRSYSLFLFADGSIEVLDTSDYLYGHPSITRDNVVAFVNFAWDSASALLVTEDMGTSVFAQCLVSGTMVCLADGTSKPVEDVSYGDDILVWDFDTGHASSAKPLWIKKPQEINFMYRIRLASGRTIDVAGPRGHRAFNIDEGRFEYLNNSVGQKVMAIDGPDVVEACELVRGKFGFHNVITYGHMNLYANGILTSCRLNNYRTFDAKKMMWSSTVRNYHAREEFEGVPDGLILGLHLCHQPARMSELKAYVVRLIESRNLTAA